MRIRKLRSTAVCIQKHRCWYCEFPIWETDQVAFAKKHGLTLRQAGRFRCTAEHLVARSDGGPDVPGNIVAACLFCNRTRHKIPHPPTHDRYRDHVARAVRRKTWHPNWAYVALAACPYGQGPPDVRPKTSLYVQKDGC